MAVKKIVEKENLPHIIADACRMAETLFGPKTGPEKKAWVVQFINDHVNLPWLNEKQEGRLIELLIDIIILLSKKLGWAALVAL